MGIFAVATARIGNYLYHESAVRVSCALSQRMLVPGHHTPKCATACVHSCRDLQDAFPHSKLPRQFASICLPLLPAGPRPEPSMPGTWHSRAAQQQRVELWPALLWRRSQHAVPAPVVSHLNPFWLPELQTLAGWQHSCRGAWQQRACCRALHVRGV